MNFNSDYLDIIVPDISKRFMLHTKTRPVDLEFAVEWVEIVNLFSANCYYVHFIVP
jgi:hypothetical protein